MSDTRVAMRDFRFLDEKRRLGGLSQVEEQRWNELRTLLGIPLEQDGYYAPEQPQGYYGADGNWYPYPPGYQPAPYGAGYDPNAPPYYPQGYPPPAPGYYPPQYPPAPGYYPPPPYDPNQGYGQPPFDPNSQAYPQAPYDPNAQGYYPEHFDPNQAPPYDPNQAAYYPQQNFADPFAAFPSAPAPEWLPQQVPEQPVQDDLQLGQNVDLSTPGADPYAQGQAPYAAPPEEVTEVDGADVMEVSDSDVQEVQPEPPAHEPMLVAAAEPLPPMGGLQAPSAPEEKAISVEPLFGASPALSAEPSSPSAAEAPAPPTSEPITAPPSQELPVSVEPVAEPAPLPAPEPSVVVDPSLTAAPEEPLPMVAAEPAVITAPPSEQLPVFVEPVPEPLPAVPAPVEAVDAAKPEPISAAPSQELPVFVEPAPEPISAAPSEELPVFVEPAPEPISAAPSQELPVFVEPTAEQAALQPPELPVELSPQEPPLLPVETAAPQETDLPPLLEALPETEPEQLDVEELPPQEPIPLETRAGAEPEAVEEPVIDLLDSEADLDGDPAEAVQLATNADFVSYKRDEPAPESQVELAEESSAFEVESGPLASIANPQESRVEPLPEVEEKIELASASEFLDYPELKNTGNAPEPKEPLQAAQVEIPSEWSEPAAKPVQPPPLRFEEASIDIDAEFSSMPAPAKASPAPPPEPQEEITLIEEEVPAPPLAAPKGDPFASGGASLATAYVEGEHRVILHTTDGQVKRGVVRDLDLLMGTVELELPAPAAPETIGIDKLKAIFFMLPQGQKPPECVGDKLRVTFNDGRQLAGFSKDHKDGAPGFFLIPADLRTNTARVFVYRAATKSIAAG